MPAEVLVAVSSALMLPGLRGLLGALEPEASVRETTDPSAVLDLISSHHTDVLLLELDHLLEGGSALLRSIRARHPETHVIVLTLDKSRESVRAAITAGASGYLFLGDDLADLPRVIRSVHAGNLQVSHSVLQFLLTTAADQAPAAPPVSLTAREQEVARLVASGHPSKDIAAQLCISLRTVDSHRANIRKKLGAQSTAEIVRYSLTQMPPG
jgi:two-component system, NarL family, nitrate/nitrite response regulator NarL